MRGLTWFLLGLGAGLAFPFLMLFSALEQLSPPLPFDASEPLKALPEVDMKELQHWEPEESSWVEVQVQWVGSELEVEKTGWRPWFYGMTLPVPMRPKTWQYWHDTVS